MEIKEGNLVISKAGRDKNKYFVVMKILGNYVFLSDGRERKIDKPKKKKIKHIQPTKMFSEYIYESIKENKELTNKEIQKEINNCICKGEVK